MALKLKIKKKMRWIITKTNNGRNVQFTKFSVIDFFLADRRNLLTAKKSFFTAEFGLLQILQWSIFVISHEKCQYQSHRVRGYSVFLFVFWFPSSSSRFRTSLSVCHVPYKFLSVSATVIRENFKKRPWSENGEGFAIYSSTWQSRAKDEWRVSSWLATSNTWKIIVFSFSMEILV